jgi:hypothetical protein
MLRINYGIGEFVHLALDVRQIGTGLEHTKEYRGGGIAWSLTQVGMQDLDYAPKRVILTCEVDFGTTLRETQAYGAFVFCQRAQVTAEPPNLDVDAIASPTSFSAVR